MRPHSSEGCGEQRCLVADGALPDIAWELSQEVYPPPPLFQSMGFIVRETLNPKPQDPKTPPNPLNPLSPKPQPQTLNPKP